MQSNTETPLRLASLCNGYGGLDLGVEQVIDARMVWCAEFEDAPSRVISQRFPGVPNVHDVKRIPWRIMAPVDVITAGYPCQPFSLAGARKGEDDPRHLWPSIAEGIRIMRPRHVFLENVRGHLSLGFDQVLFDLDGMGYAVVWRILAASDVGACHRRERLWIYAQPREQVAPVSTPVLAVAGEQAWMDAEEDLFGDRMPWTGQIPPAGMMHTGRIRAVPMHRTHVPGPLLPTPNAAVSNDGEGPETWLARRERVRAKGINGNGMGMPLSIAVQLLPTPTASNATSGADYARTERPGAGGDDLVTAIQLLPTPSAALAAGGQTARGGARSHEPLLGGIVIEASKLATWGKFTSGILRHTHLIDRDPPAPTLPNAKGNPELAPVFVEWMQCLPAGWVTGVDFSTLRSGNDKPITARGIRDAQLTMLGNGVVWICAAAAYASLIALAAGAREKVAA